MTGGLISDLIQRFAIKDNRVVAIDKVNGGLSSARNMGIDVAKGEWLMFIDSDDSFQKLYKMYV